MRISPINCVPATTVHNNVQTKINETIHPPIENGDNSVSFKNKIRWGGAIGCVVGTLAGVGLGTIATIATGGLAAPLILGMAGCAAGGIGGDVIDSKINKNYPKSDTIDTDYYDRNDMTI